MNSYGICRVDPSGSLAMAGEDVCMNTIRVLRKCRGNLVLRLSFLLRTTTRKV